MDTDRLKGLWQQRTAEATPDGSGEANRIAERVDRLRRQIRRRDYFEHAAAFVCIVVFGRLVFVLQPVVARAAAAFLAASAFVAIVKLIRANPGRRQTDKAVTVREFCENELRRLDAQIRLLRTVPFWSVGPALVGANVLFAALSPRLLWTVSYLLVTLAFGAWVCYANRQAVRRQLVPLREELLRILREEP